MASLLGGGKHKLALKASQDQPDIGAAGRKRALTAGPATRRTSRGVSASRFLLGLRAGGYHVDGAQWTWFR
jgi:hypothetical protein